MLELRYYIRLSHTNIQTVLTDALWICAFFNNAMCALRAIVATWRRLYIMNIGNERVCLYLFILLWWDGDDESVHGNVL